MCVCVCVGIKAQYTTYCDGCVMVAWAGDSAVWDDLLMKQRRAPLGLGLGTALRQVVIVDLILFIGNLFTEPEGTSDRQELYSDLLISHHVKPVLSCVCRLFMFFMDRHCQFEFTQRCVRAAGYRQKSMLSNCSHHIRNPAFPQRRADRKHECPGDQSGSNSVLISPCKSTEGKM